MAETVEQAARELVERKAVAIGKCREGHRHGFGCPLDGEPLVADCQTCGKADECYHCRFLRSELDTVQGLLAALSSPARTEDALQYALALMRGRLDVEAPTNAAKIREYIAALEATPAPPPPDAARVDDRCSCGVAKARAHFCADLDHCWRSGAIVGGAA